MKQLVRSRLNFPGFFSPWNVDPEVCFGWLKEIRKEVTGAMEGQLVAIRF